MAPSIPTHRPFMTATRVAIVVALASCVSTLVLALTPTRAQATEGSPRAALAACTSPALAR